MSEVLDSNKTALTHRVTALAAAYLDGLGCKPVETEVPIQPGWVADVASFWYPSLTESKRLGLSKRARARLGNDLEIGNPISRAYGEGPFTVLVEVKTSRSDFTRDTKKWEETPAHLCFIAYPTGLMDKEEIPRGWAGLQMSKNGTKVCRTHHASVGYRFHAQHSGDIIDFIAAVGIRRDHRTRNASMRDWAKSYRAKEAKEKVRDKTATLVNRISEWLQGETTEDDLRKVLMATGGIKRMPKYCDPAIAYFESIRGLTPNTKKAG